jgi:HK97 family phage major capsid protein
VIKRTSFVEANARREPMGTDTKTLNRQLAEAGVAITAKGVAYNEEIPTGDEVTLTVRKFTAALRIAEEDVADLPASGVANYISSRQQGWASNYAKFLDNACLGVTAASNGGTIPFTSLYRSLSTTTSSVGYTANDNIVQTGGALTYAKLSAVLAKLENSDFYDFGNVIVVAHPSLIASFRNLVDDQHRPLFDSAPGGQPGQADQKATLFGLPVQFSQGAKTSAVASVSPSGNPLLFVVNKQALILGVRSGPESVAISGWDGTSSLTDEAIVKMRSRRAFVAANPKAAAVLEITA